MMNNSVYGSYRTRKFVDIFGTQEDDNEVIPNVDTFLESYHDCVDQGMGTYDPSSNTTIGPISDNSAKALFWLLYGRYGNSHISNSDETQFIYKLFSIVFQYGGAWEKRLAIQTKMKNMDLDGDEILYSSNQIMNQAENPSTEIQAGNELTTINTQNVNKYKRGKIDALAFLDSVLKTDVSDEFLNKFKKLFLIIVEPQDPLWYSENTESED